MNVSAENVRNAWDGIASGFDQYVTPYTMSFSEQVLSSIDIRPGTRFLDIGAGTGAMALPAARLGADVLATDLSPAMIERIEKRARSEGLPNLRAQVMNGTSLALEPDSFDVTASQNGVSLFPDAGAGLLEMARVTAPGGKVLVVAFGRMDRAEFIGFVIRALHQAIPGFEGLPADETPLPFQFADPQRMQQCLVEAGLVDVSVQSRSWSTEFGSPEELLNTFTNGNPIAKKLVADLDEDGLDSVRSALATALAERAGDGRPAVLTTAMNVGLGTKPGA